MTNCFVSTLRRFVLLLPWLARYERQPTTPMHALTVVCLCFTVGVLTRHPGILVMIGLAIMGLLSALASAYQAYVDETGRRSFRPGIQEDDELLMKARMKAARDEFAFRLLLEVVVLALFELGILLTHLPW